MPSSLRWFRIAAIAEACSWAGLLVGMFFKYVIVHNEIGVKIFGPVHGVLFLAYLLSLAFAKPDAGWSIRTFALGVASAIPPFATLWFERYGLTRRVDAEAQASEA